MAITQNMDMPINTLALAFYVLCATFLAIFVTFYVLKKKGLLEQRKEGGSIRKPTHFLDVNEVDDKCDICFGKLEDGDVVECGCGKVFHIECVDLTEECPYCRCSPGEMTERRLKRGICPKCGSRIEDNICSCGIVMPWKDGTFRCACGHEMYIGDTECPRCGAQFIEER